jgi:hypothetical protein
MSKGQKKYLILRTIEMGGNYMVEKYLWNGQDTTILYTKRQYTKKHVMTVKSFLASFMNEKITIDLIHIQLWCIITRVLRLQSVVTNTELLPNSTCNNEWSFPWAHKT